MLRPAERKLAKCTIDDTLFLGAVWREERNGVVVPRDVWLTHLGEHFLIDWDYHDVAGSVRGIAAGSPIRSYYQWRSQLSKRLAEYPQSPDIELITGRSATESYQLLSYTRKA